MNKPEPINTAPQPIITKRLLAQIAGKAIAEAEGQFTAADICERVKNTAISANCRPLLDETCWSVTRKAIDAHPKIAREASAFRPGRDSAPRKARSDAG